MMSVDRELDKWAAWVLHRRDGDDLEQRGKALEHLLPIRERVLDNARIREGETLMGVGTGDGLIAFGALDRVGPNGRSMPRISRPISSAALISVTTPDNV